MGAIPFAGYSFLFLAQEWGLMDPRWVQMKELRSSTDVMRALATDRLEAAALTLDETVSCLQGGIGLRVVAVLDQSVGADAVVARAPLRHPSDIRGRRVAVESSAVGALMFAALLQAAGLKATDVEQVPTPLPETAAAYRSGRADVVVTAEPWASQLTQEGAQRLLDSRALPGRIVDVLVVRTEVLDSHARQIGAAVQGHFAALARHLVQPEATTASLAAHLQLAATEVPLAFQGLNLPDRAGNQRLLAPGGDVARGVPGLVALMRSEGLIDARPVPFDGLFDTRWVQGPP